MTNKPVTDKQPEHALAGSLSVSTVHEALLTILAGESPSERIVVCHCSLSDGGSRVELRQQSYGEGVGWFTQSSVTLDPQQVAGLRSSLGGRSSAQPRTPNWQPRVVRADIA